jgi:hypothetical protein
VEEEEEEARPSDSSSSMVLFVDASFSIYIEWRIWERIWLNGGIEKEG